MEVRGVTNSEGTKQVILIGLNKFDVNVLRKPGSESILICTSENTILAVARIDANTGVDDVMRIVVDKLNMRVQEKEDEGHEG